MKNIHRLEKYSKILRLFLKHGRIKVKEFCKQVKAKNGSWSNF